LPDLRRMREFGNAVVNYSDHCMWAEACHSQKPTCYHTEGRHHRFNTVCRQGDDCGYVRPDGRHIRSIVGYNDPTQERVPDAAPERSAIPCTEIGFLVANALSAQDRQWQWHGDSPRPERTSDARGASCGQQCPILCAPVASTYGTSARAGHTDRASCAGCSPDTSSYWTCLPGAHPGLHTGLA
jgi:hypothetical protein